ncbi:MAG: PrgI family protein [Candidatus Campbellbacteria bacterium]|nr:PrgI family protein [Candidatus Campbellbacteria bacterium]
MRFQVPQFIEIEDKIFGPLSFKQFIYVIGGAGISYFIYQLLPLYLAMFIIAPVIGLSLALAFYKFNKKPFVYTLEAAFRYITKNKLYLWKKRKEDRKTMKKTLKEHEEVNDAYQPIAVPHLSESKLKDISWNLEVEEKVKAKDNE